MLSVAVWLLHRDFLFESLLSHTFCVPKKQETRAERASPVRNACRRRLGLLGLVAEVHNPPWAPSIEKGKKIQIPGELFFLSLYFFGRNKSSCFACRRLFSFTARGANQKQPLVESRCITPTNPLLHQLGVPKPIPYLIYFEKSYLIYVTFSCWIIILIRIHIHFGKQYIE